MSNRQLVYSLGGSTAATALPAIAATWHVTCLSLYRMREPHVPGFQRTRVISVEVTEPAEPIVATGYDAVLALVRVVGAPVGCVTLPVIGGECDGEDARRRAIERLKAAIDRQLAVNAIRTVASAP